MDLAALARFKQFNDAQASSHRERGHGSFAQK